MNKTVRFSLYGATGALVAAALCGLILRLLIPASAGPQRSIALVIDRSGSMYFDPDPANPNQVDSRRPNTRMKETTEAATKFVERQRSDSTSFAVISFHGEATLDCEPTNEFGKLRAAILRLRTLPGGGTMPGRAFAMASKVLKNAPGDRFVVIFTDGEPNPGDTAAEASNDLRRAGVRVLAIGTKEAPPDTLESWTGDPDLVFTTEGAGYESAFQRAEKQLQSLTGAKTSSFASVVATTVVFGGLLAAGICVALTLGQLSYMKKPAEASAVAMTAGGAIIGGSIAGVVGQALYTYAGETQFLLLAGWTVLGGVIGFALSYFIPNLPPTRALLAGVVGGVLGGAGLVAMMSLAGDVAGSLIGAAILGAAIGAAIAFMEQFVREAWLEISYGPNETRTVGLGEQPVTFGSNSACTVFAFGTPPVAARFSVAGGVIRCEDPTSGRVEDVAIGETRRIGSLQVRVCGQVTNQSPSQEIAPPPPYAPSGAPPLLPASPPPTPAQPVPPRAAAASPRPAATPAPAPAPAPARTPPAALPPAATAPIVLRVGRLDLGLAPGLRLTAAHLVFLRSAGTDAVVAEVRTGSSGPELVNRSTAAWTVRGTGGPDATVAAGAAAPLRTGVTIRFAGSLEGIVTVRKA